MAAAKDADRKNCLIFYLDDRLQNKVAVTGFDDGLLRVEIKYERVDIEIQTFINFDFQPRLLGAGRLKRVNCAVHHDRVVVAEYEADFLEHVGGDGTGGEQRVYTILEIEQVVNASVGVQRHPLRGVAGGFDADFLNVHVHLLIVAGAVGESDVERDGVFVVFVASDETDEAERKCD